MISEEVDRMGRNKWYQKNSGDSLPITYKTSGHLVTGIILILIGAFFGILMGWSLVEEILDKGFELSQLGMLIIILPGLAFFVIAFFLFYRIDLSIDAHSVNFKKRRLFFKNSVWSERLSEYDGILMEETCYSHRDSEGISSKSYTMYRLTLRNATEKKRSVVLYASRKPKGFREQSEKFSRLLHKPIFQNTGDDEWSVRDVDHLDSRAAELVQEGKMKVQFNENMALLFKNIQRERMGDVLRITIRAGIGKSFPIVFVLVAGLVAGLPFFIEHEIMKVIPFNYIAGFFAFFGLTLFLVSKVKRVLTVAPDKITHCYELMGKAFSEQSILSSQIEEVSIFQRKNEKVKQIQIAGDQGSIHVGQTLTDEEREWVKNCILSTIR